MNARTGLSVVALEHARESDARCRCGENWLPSHVADANIAAIRAMPVEDQAELIRGTVDHLAGLVRVQGDWRKP